MLNRDRKILMKLKREKDKKEKCNWLKKKLEKGNYNRKKKKNKWKEILEIK